MLSSIKSWLDFLVSIIKALFKLKNSDSIQNAQNQQQQQQQQAQQHLQNEYNKIDQQNVSKPNPTLQEVENKLNDRF